MHHQQATMLMVIRELMVCAGLKCKITRVGGPRPDHFTVTTIGVKGHPSHLVVPLIDQVAKMTILSLLQYWRGRTSTWLFNGQAGQGTRQLLHYGGSGACVVEVSKTTLDATYNEWYGIGGEVKVASWREAERLAAPRNPRLYIQRADEDLETVELPGEDVSIPIYKALREGVQRIKRPQARRIAEALSYGFDLGIVEHDYELLLGRTADLLPYRRAIA